jgi:hypothetical protein
VTLGSPGGSPPRSARTLVSFFGVDGVGGVDATKTYHNRVLAGWPGDTGLSHRCRLVSLGAEKVAFGDTGRHLVARAVSLLPRAKRAAFQSAIRPADIDDTDDTEKTTNGDGAGFGASRVRNQGSHGRWSSGDGAEPVPPRQVLLYVRRAARAECGRDDHMIRLRPELSPMQREAVAAYTARAAEDGLCRACSGRT